MVLVIKASQIMDAFGSRNYDDIVERLSRSVCQSRLVRFEDLSAIIAFGQIIEKESKADRWLKKRLETERLPPEVWTVIAGTARLDSRTQRFAAMKISRAS